MIPYVGVCILTDTCYYIIVLYSVLMYFAVEKREKKHSVPLSTFLLSILSINSVKYIHVPGDNLYPVLHSSFIQVQSSLED